jgi:GAF domain-containing protein
MKNNAEEAAAVVKRAISLITSDFALTEARNYLYAAVAALDRAQKKRDRRERNYQENKRLALISKQEAEKRLAALNEMLRLEYVKREGWKQQSGSNPSETA